MLSESETVIKGVANHEIELILAINLIVQGFYKLKSFLRSPACAVASSRLF